MYTVFRGGYNAKHAIGFVMSRPKGLYCYLFLIIRSPAKVQIGENHFQVTDDTAVIISPDVPYQYSAMEGEYRNDWLYFDSSEETFKEEYSEILNKPVPLGNSLYFTQYFRNIIWESSYAPEEYRQQNVSMLLQIVLNKLKQEKQSTGKSEKYYPYASRLQEIRLTMKSRPYSDFTPKELSEKLSVSPSYFQFLYKDFFGVPFKADLIHMRLDYARELILETNLTLEQIALMSGYKNEVHFYRQFKAKTGMTPKEYRISGLNKSFETEP
ncbi:MAG: AraC family transcriptional regulator [Fusicatenibacter sp.]|nr:AraC family transcriptional regulator [Lachnospiraceae bacterium]MDY2938227.1 AraC family transcriptional regulator [Fusicatenibacter sp.]